MREQTDKVYKNNRQVSHNEYKVELYYRPNGFQTRNMVQRIEKTKIGKTKRTKVCQTDKFGVTTQFMWYTCRKSQITNVRKS